VVIAKRPTTIFRLPRARQSKMTRWRLRSFAGGARSTPCTK